MEGAKGQQQQSSALHGHHLNVLGAVQPQRGGSIASSSADQQQQQLVQAGEQSFAGLSSGEEQQLLLFNDLNIAPSEIDELLDSLVQSYDEQSFLQYGCAGGVADDLPAAAAAAVFGADASFCFGEAASSGEAAEAASSAASEEPFDPDSLLNSFPLGVGPEQLFASIDQSTLELAAGGDGSQSGGRQSGEQQQQQQSLAFGGAATCGQGQSAAQAARPLSGHHQCHVDHDYAATLKQVPAAAGLSTDLNNNNNNSNNTLDLLDSLLAASSFPVSSSSGGQPISPLSSSSLADIGYESAVASPVGSDGGLSVGTNSSTFGASPLLSSTGLFEQQDPASSLDEQEMLKLMDDLTEERLFADSFLGGHCSTSSMMAPIDPMLIDPTFLDSFPEMF